MLSEKVVVSAPGKVILHGEHAVVYGKSAIAASLDIRSYLELSVTDTGVVDIELPAVNLSLSWPLQKLRQLVSINEANILEPERPKQSVLEQMSEFVCGSSETTKPSDQATLAFLYLYTAICDHEKGLPSLKVKVISKLPVSAGLGSSASFSVCLAAALLLSQNHISDPRQCGWAEKDLDLINKWAFQGERIIHGNPSGIDNAVATYGGAIKLNKGNITKLEKVPKLRILLTSTNVPRSTKALVAQVRERYDKFPEVLGPVMDAIEAISEKAQQTYVAMTTEEQQNMDNHLTTLEELVDMNQHLLQVMGVSHPSLDKICHVTSKYSLHSKLTGAGGGGCAVTLLAPSTSSDIIAKVKVDLEPDGFKCWETNVGAEGVAVLDELPNIS